MWNECEIEEVHGISVRSNGWVFWTIYGRDASGWFIAIPNWGVALRSADPENYAYNTSLLQKEDKLQSYAGAIAVSIKEHWESIKNCGEEKRCGNCVYHVPMPLGEYVCICEESEAEGVYTQFDDYCEMFAEKES